MDLEKKTYKARGGASPINVGEAFVLKNQVDPQMPILKGGAEIAQGILGHLSNEMEKNRQAEAASDEIAAKAHWHKLEAETWEKIQNATVGGEDATDEEIARIVESSFQEMEDQFSEYEEGISSTGFFNVRDNDAKRNINLWRESQMANSQVKAMEYLFRKRREETVRRFDMGLDEAIKDAGPNAEEAINKISQTMREIGADPEEVRIKQEASLEAVSISRLQRDLSSLQSAYATAGEEDLEEISQDFQDITNALTPGHESHEASGYNHISSKKLEELRNQIPEIEKGVRQSIRNNIQEKKYFDSLEYQRQDAELYARTLNDENPLTNEELNQRLADGKISREIHQNYASYLGRKREMDNQAIERGRNILHDQLLEEYQQGKLPREDFLAGIEKDYQAGIISETKYNSLRRKTEEGGSSNRNSVRILRRIEEGNTQGSDWGNLVIDAYESGEVTFSQAQSLFNPPSPSGEQRKLLESEYKRIKEKIDLHMDNEEDFFFYLYDGPEEDFEEQRKRFTPSLFDKGKSRQRGNFDSIKMSPNELINFRYDLHDWIILNPDASQSDLRAKMEEMLEGKAFDQAIDRYRFENRTVMERDQEVEDRMNYFGYPDTEFGSF